jgi:uncharacterized membrane protein AbrB (regulator of aidB expression)
VTRSRTRAGSWARAALAATVLANLVVLYWPRSVSQGGVPYADKVVHVAIFAVVAIAGLLARVPLGWLVGLLVADAVSSEFLQHWLLANRTGDPLDVVADLVGVAVGVFVGTKLSAGMAATATRSGGSSLS